MAGDEFRSAAAVLLNRCYECHNAQEHSGGLDLASRAGLERGGENGPVIVAGKPEESWLLERVEAGEMPPRKAGKAQPVPPEEIRQLRAWIAAGASWPEGLVLDPFEATSATRAGRDFWSLRPVIDAAVPRVRQGELVQNEVDAFLLSKLEARGWTYAPEADRRTLIRRLSIDLTGLNPAYEEVEAFVADAAPGSYERLVDRLLASPHYGERWGRFWLDVARYADTCGYERDQAKPNAWKYRDWVFQRFNDDAPFDSFVVEQLAGDELPGRTEAQLVATGFIRLGAWNDEPNDPQEYKYDRLEDMVDATSTAFLAMTVKCARCHDHKFDPIRQTDYYRLAAAFWAGPIEPAARELLGGPDPKVLGSDAFAWTDLSRDPPPFHLLKKGDPNKPGAVIEPAQLSFVAALEKPLERAPADARTSQRRLQMARWMVDPSNPLTARVWVNRVWQHHFGAGLVRSPDNFGFTGERPTHPELLDWLATRFVEGGWRSKPIHRLLVLSRAYRQASLHPDQEALEREDAGNQLWWHAQRQRLDAEALRDAVLSASGELNRARMGGPGFVPDIAPDALEGLSMKDKAWAASPAAEQKRRGVYMFVKRGLLAPLMTTFDAPDTTLPCGQRDVTLVPTQALALMNNAFVHEQSRAVADLIRREMPNADASAAIGAAWRRILMRDPTPREAAAARAFLGDGGSGACLASLCHVLLNTNEFLYVD